MRTEGKLHMSDTSIPQFAELPRLPTGVVCCQNIFAKNSNITINKVPNYYENNQRMWDE